ncbi:MAG: DNA polymerase III subunit gamma/tau, partial [Muribaculaceae bacterium]|nr:DNA polymerase III subunit gamma/tau [Muribaculaceae bacterium]
GKTSCARIFAKTINCENPGPDGEACNQCSSCAAFNEGRSLNIVELDAASHNGVDDIRALVEQVQLPPTQGRYRVFIIDEVHMLSSAAFNAFLKTLEEPPSYVIFILATTEKHKIIPTILSRCQIYDFNRITIRDMVSHMAYVAQQEGITADPAALAVIAAKADGAMRDALSIFDQVAASSRGNITYQSAIDNLNVLDHAYYKRLIDAFVANNVPEALLIYKQIRDKGFDSQFFVNGLALYIRDLMLAANPLTLPMLEVPDEMRAEMAATAAKCSPQFLYKAMDLCNSTDLNYRQASNKQFLVELMLIKLCQPLSPSQNDSGVGEGQLKPIAAFTQPAAAKTSVAQTAPVAKVEVKNPETPKSQAQRPAPYSVAAQPQSTVAEPRVNTANFTPKLRTPGLSLHKTQAAEAQTTAPESVITEKRNTPCTDTTVTNLWRAYMHDHGTEHLLINIMRNCTPSKTDECLYRVEIENEVQLGLFNDHLADINGYMRDNLANDSFSLEAVIKDGPSSPKTWTEREVLAHMKSTNPEFNAFVDEFKLTLL